MGFFSNAISRSSLKNPSRWLIDFFSGGGVSESGVNVNENSMMSESAVWCAINFLASNIASLPCPVLKNDGRKREKQPVFYLHQRLNSMANPEMISMIYRETCLYHLFLWGNSVSIIERNQLGQVVALWPVHPDRWEIERKGKRLIYHITLENGTIKPFPRRKILHIPGLGNGLMGMSVMEKSTDSVGLIIAMRSFANLFFKNGSNMGVVFEHPKRLGTEAHKSLTWSLKQAYSGLGKSHRAMVAEEGMKVNKIGVEPEKSQLVESRQFAITDVARWFNLPPHILKDLSRATFSNIQEQSLELVIYTLRPWFVRLEQSYESYLLREGDKGIFTVRHNANALMRGNEKSRSEYYKMRFSTGSITPNEIRGLEDENPIEEKWADKAYLQLNISPADELSAAIQKSKKVKEPKKED